MTRVTRGTFDRAVQAAAKLHERTIILGALLQKAIGPSPELVIAGGSAIAIWTSGDYVSGDIDLVGPRAKLEPILSMWGFVKTDDPDGRVYWSRPDLGLLVDIINRADYVGNSEGLLRLQTPFGPIQAAAVEDLILRRLVIWKRGGQPEMLDQAVALLLQHSKKIDAEYLSVLTRNEGIEDAYRAAQQLAEAATTGRARRTGRSTK
jgi:hypothetical protein